MSYIVKQVGRNRQINVYIAENRYDREKRQSRQKRTYLGVFDEKRGELLLGKNTPEPDKELLSLLASKNIKYLGHKADLPGRKPVAGSKRRFRLSSAVGDVAKLFKIMEVGRIKALWTLAEDSGLVKALSEAFGVSAGRRLLGLAAHQVCEGDALYLACPWLEETGEFEGEGISVSSLNRLLTSVGSDENARDAFFAKWIELSGCPRVLIHDTTSISSYACGLDSVEWGYNRDNENLPQINLAFVISREKGLPLWYRTVPGSIPDVSSLELTKKMLERYGLTKADYSLDRGYFSNDNLIDLLESKSDFTIGVPFTNTQARDLASRNLSALMSVRRSFLYSGERLRYVRCEYKVSGINGEQATLPAHLYFNPERKEKTLKNLETTILGLECKAACKSFRNGQSAWKWIKENAGGLAKFLTVTNKNGQWRVVRKSNALTKAARHFGLTLILTTKTKRNREDVLTDYRCRDAVEKLFDVYKNITGNKRLRCASESSAEGRVFLAFLSVILYALLNSRLRSSDIGKSCSVREVLSMLRKVKKLRFPDGETLFMEVPKKVRNVIRSLGLIEMF